MALEERRAWIRLVVSVGAYTAYLVVTLVRADRTAFTAVPYASTMLWTIGAAIVVAIVLDLAIRYAAPGDASASDQRDREITRIGESIGQSFLAIGGVAALGMSMAELDHFWIANTIYLAFVLSATVGSVARIFAYRQGFQTW